MPPYRGVAQFGSAPHWGCGGHRFKSCRPDQFKHGLFVFEYCHLDRAKRREILVFYKEISHTLALLESGSK
jgi:hypothetical protein